METRLLFITLFYFSLTTGSIAQPKKFKFTDCASLKRYYAMKGDVITFNCDSILLLNTKSFRYLDSSYFHLKKVSNSLIIETNAESLTYQKLYEDKTKQYQLLTDDFANFRLSTTDHIDSIDKQLEGVKDNLINTKKELDSASTAIAKAMDDINKARSNQKWTNIKWGGIGFGLATLVFVVAK